MLGMKITLVCQILLGSALTSSAKKDTPNALDYPCPAQGWNINEGDMTKVITKLNTDTWEECGMQCSVLNPTLGVCKCWSWVMQPDSPQHTECYLLSGKDTVTQNYNIWSGDSSCTSSPTTPAPEPTTETPPDPVLACPTVGYNINEGDMSNVIIREIQPTWQECGTSCNSNAECKFWSWVNDVDNAQYTQCYLITELDTVVENPHITSGDSNCTSNGTTSPSPKPTDVTDGPTEPSLETTEGSNSTDTTPPKPTDVTDVSTEPSTETTEGIGSTDTILPETTDGITDDTTAPPPNGTIFNFN